MTETTVGDGCWPRFLPAGECALSVEFAPEISPETSQRVRALLSALDRSPPAGLRDLVPSYRALLILYDPLELEYERLTALVEELLEDSTPSAAPSRHVTLPVCYGADFGPDLRDVAERAGLTIDEVIAIHSEAEYLVYFLGFAPGFPYLGGLDARLSTPRLPRPRTSVPAGSVGIGGEQTGVYSLSTPGGWRLLGRTPVPLYNPAAPEPFLLRAGDRLRFEAVERATYDGIAAEVSAGLYQPRIRDSSDTVSP